MSGELSEIDVKVAQIKSILDGIVLKKRALITTRSFEDDWNWGGSDFIPWGNDWMWEDPNGDYHQVIDSDGDGRPDSVLLPDVNITPNPNPDPNPWPSDPINPQTP